MTIEKLTDEQRRIVCVQGAAAMAALRIIDAQASEIERLQIVRYDDLDECERLAARCAELEAERGRWQTRLAPSAAEARLAEATARIASAAQCLVYDEDLRPETRIERALAALANPPAVQKDKP